jgi:hypothetical protein
MNRQPNVDVKRSKNLLRAVTTNERGPYIDRSVIPTLDLHGFFLDAAIKKLVEFLETHYAIPKAVSPSGSPRSLHTIVQIITGTGSHSTSAGGPVLKYAVNDFLQRHSFQYTYYNKGGYFVIPLDNNTGVLSYQSNTCNVSTKLIITSPCTLDKTLGNHLKKSQSSDRKGLKSEKHQLFLPTEELPTLQEVVRDEQELERGVNESLEEYRQRQKEYAKEQKLYRETIQASKEEILKLEQEEKLMLERAVQESVELSEREYDDNEEEELTLKQAILESLEESGHSITSRGDSNDNEADSDLLQRVIMESKALYDASERDDDDDSLLQRIIHESKTYF